MLRWEEGEGRGWSDAIVKIWGGPIKSAEFLGSPFPIGSGQECDILCTDRAFNSELNLEVSDQSDENF